MAAELATNIAKKTMKSDKTVTAKDLVVWHVFLNCEEHSVDCFIACWQYFYFCWVYVCLCEVFFVARC